MNKIIALLLSFVMLLSLAACDTERPQDKNEPAVTVHKDDSPVINNVEIKVSPDKYTWYIKNYVGKNLAAIGYTSMGGERLDSYGSGLIELILLTPNGEYVDIHDDNDLKNWRVIGQNLEPNTEIKYTFMVDSEGEEYDNLIAYQNISEIVLALAPVGEDVKMPELTEINASADRYTRYICDYVGRNLSQCGYVSMAGKLMDEYGSAYIHLAVYADDGSFVDIQDSTVLKNYMVVSQSVAPNTELKLTYLLDSDGKEYDNLIDTQNIEEIELYVTQVNFYTNEPEETEPTEIPTEAPETEAEKDQNTLVDGMRPEFKEAMDAYEAFYDEYCDFMKEYKENPSDLTLLLKYGEMLTKVAEMDEAFEKWDEEDLNDVELKYYLEVNNRVMQKMIDVIG